MVRQIVDRHRRHFEAAPALGQNQPLGCEAAQDLPQRADTDAVAFLEPVELELLARRQAPEHDIGPNPPMTVVANGRAVVGSLDQGHFDPMLQIVRARNLFRAPRTDASYVIEYQNHHIKSILYFDSYFTI
jgi:hypothetical protein